jgi:hypothetical protein
MKSKEEIEQLAKQLCNIPIDLVIDEEERYYKNLEKYDGIIQGYTKCQEDMADKKYTEEDMLKCWDSSTRFERPISEGYAPNFNEFINSLNKQD